MGKFSYLIDTAAVTPLCPAVVLHKVDDIYAPTGRTVAPDDLPRDCETFVIGEKDNNAVVKHLNKTNDAQLRVAVHDYLSLANAVPSEKVGWLLLTLCLTSLASDLLDKALPFRLAVWVRDATIPSRYLELLLNLHNLFPVLCSGKHGKQQLRQPAVLNGNKATTAFDLLGGTAKADFGKIRLWLPVCNRPVAILPTVRDGLRTEILEISPFALPIFLDRKPPSKAVKVEFKTTDFEEYDLSLLNAATGNAKDIRAVLAAFSEWIHEKKKRHKELVASIDRFIPVARNGRFSRDLRGDPQVMFRAAALAVLQSFLHFCCKRDWLNIADADEYLTEAWTAIMPESAPVPPPDGYCAASAVCWDTQEVFWDFLRQYLEDGRRVLYDRKAQGDTLALVNAIGKMRYLILPREHFCTAYRDHLTAFGGAVPDGDFEHLLLHQLTETWGIDIHTEKDDIGYRYTFYQETNASVKKAKIPCIALPVAQLPSDLQTRLHPNASEPSAASSEREEVNANA